MNPNLNLPATYKFLAILRGDVALGHDSRRCLGNRRDNAKIAVFAVAVVAVAIFALAVGGWWARHLEHFNILSKVIGTLCSVHSRCMPLAR